MPLIQLSAVTVGYGGPPILDAVDLVMQPGERLCLLGRNGAGKSTLLRVISRTIEPDSGQVNTKGVRVATLTQHVPSDLDGTVLDLALAQDGVEPHAARAAISRVGLEAYAPLADLSAGLKRRALLARALASEPDLLLLDEPTNHLDIASIDWLETFLRKQMKSLLFVTHDRAFLKRLATGILDLDRGQLRRYDADYDKYLDLKTGRLGSEERTNRQFDKKLADEEVWIRRGVKARRKRNQGRVRELEKLRDTRGERREVEGSVKMEAGGAGRTGRMVLRAENVDFAFDGKQIVRDLTMTVARGDRVGIIGPNGSGKTTLIRLLLGELEPDAGQVRQGTNLEIAYFDQLHRTLDDSASAAQNVADGESTVLVNGRERSVIGYLRDFLFSADQARNPIRDLSGGERNRLLLARLFARPSNVLVLDEPTNDLDVETLEVLEGLLTGYPGTILVVSHDRELLDHVVTSTFELHGDGGWGEFAGGYTDWLAQRKPTKTEKTRKKSKPRERQARPKSTLSNDERKELQALPRQIEALETKQAALHETFADPAFLSGPGDAIAAATKHLEVLTTEIASAYARWEALEAKRAPTPGA